MRLTAIPPEVLAVAIGAALLVAVVQTVRLVLARWLPARRLQQSRERGAEGEVRAEALLRRLGYRILARQAALTYGVHVDGSPMLVSLRADFLVSHGPHRFVAEVKTGRIAPRLDTPATRRQLLEYRMAFDTAGVLLVDVDAGRVHTIEFPLQKGTPRPPARLAWTLFGILLGLATALAARAALTGTLR